VIPAGILAAQRSTAALYEDVVLADSPAVFLRPEGSSGTTVLDSSGNARNGTATSGTDLAASPVRSSGTAIHLNGSQRVTVPHNAAFNIASKYAPFTIECWVQLDNPDAAALQIIADKGNLTSANGQWTLYYDNRNIGAGTVQNLRFRFNNAASRLCDWTGTATRDALGAGFYLVASCEPSNTVLYADGVAKATVTRVVGTEDVTAGYSSSLSIGGKSSDGSFPLTGTVDEFAIYQGNLTTAKQSARLSAA
jgi:hypothetical protein